MRSVVRGTQRTSPALPCGALGPDGSVVQEPLEPPNDRPTEQPNAVSKQATMDLTESKAETATRTGEAFRAAYVAIIGRPNVGKSTLMNRLLQQKLSIVSPRPQTTWHRILGIRNLPQAQLLFLDTPGMHKSAAVFNQSLVRSARRAIADADIILWLLDPSRPEDPDDQLTLEQLREGKPAHTPVILALNKVDLEIG